MPRARLILPVVSQGAEHLAMGYLMRRNILAYKAPTNNEGYDLICIHPNPRKVAKQVRVQIKSRYQTDSDKSVFVKKNSLTAFDYLIAVFLNIGYFFRKSGQRGGSGEPEFYTLPARFVRKHLVGVKSGMDRLRLRNLDVSRYKNEKGFELIARALRIPYPRRN